MREKYKWSLAIGYTLLIYVTLPFMRGWLNFLRKFFGNSGFSGFVNFFLLLVFLAVLFFLRKSLKKIFIFVLISSVFFVFVKNLEIPEERIHFFEYALLGFLFADACFSTFVEEKKKILFALLISISAGIVDELLQGILPTRYFDWRDILFNAVAGTGGVFIRKWIFA